MDVVTIVHRVQARLRRVEGALAVTAGLVALAGATSAGAWVFEAPAVGATVGLGLCGAIVAVGLRRARLAWTPLVTAGAIEARVSGLDNLVMTAVELQVWPERASSRMRAEVSRQASDRASRIRPEVVVPLRRPLLLLGSVTVSAAAVLWGALGVAGPGPPRGVGMPAAPGMTGVRFEVTPPAYLDGPREVHEEPEQITLVAGSTLRLEVAATTRLAWAEEGADGTRLLRRHAAGAFAAEWVPARTVTLVVAAGDSAGVASAARLFPVAVVPDERPHVTITTPGRDLGFATPTQAVELQVEAEDDHALRSLELRFTRLSGSGESFTFVEGRVPITVDQVSGRRWIGRATWRLASLGLDDGDAVVYRAVARDANPASDWASSESYTIEIGRRLEFASAGAAVPDEDRRYAISQQMVIVKTERLLAERVRQAPEEWTEQTRLLAVEQRMVRSEVVFLSGGEVQDEVEEAAHSDELQEGRLENRGRAEMLRAINQMSRAEARLIEGDAAGALSFERAALEALQRAFDRRRYFLRTLPERSRVDPARRLSGDRRESGSFSRPLASTDADSLAVERALMLDLAALAEKGGPAAPALVARLASLDPRSAAWRAAAEALASAGSPDARREAARDAMNLVAARARDVLPPAMDGALSAEPGALRGWWAEERRARRNP